VLRFENESTGSRTKTPPEIDLETLGFEVPTPIVERSRNHSSIRERHSEPRLSFLLILLRALSAWNV